MALVMYLLAGFEVSHGLVYMINNIENLYLRINTRFPEILAKKFYLFYLKFFLLFSNIRDMRDFALMYQADEVKCFCQNII